MAGPVTVVWDEALAAYDFGPEHPLRPARVQLTMALARACGLLEGARLVEPAAVSGTDLARVHELDYLAGVKAAGHGDGAARFGFGPGDNPPFAGMHEASARVCGSTVAVEVILSGQAEHAFSPAGGLHHAMPDRAAGFCVYNDVALAVAAARRRLTGCLPRRRRPPRRRLEALFAGEPGVLTVSIHEPGSYLFPGTGVAHEGGEDRPRHRRQHAAGALDQGRPVRGRLRAVVPALVRAFEPELLVSQQGCDSHAPTRSPTSG